MKKKNLLLVAMLFAMLLLVACNTTEAPPTTEPATDSVTTTGEEEKDSGEINETDEKQKNSTENDPVTEDGPKTTPNDKENTTKVSGDNYTVEIAQGFTFTPEEPGKDVILYDENDKVSMRIEALTKNDTTYQDLITNTEDWMNAVSEQYETNNIDALLTDQSISNAASYIAKFEDEKVITVVFEKGNLLVRLTVFDQNDVNLTDQLIKMGFTIQEK